MDSRQVRFAPLRMPLEERLADEARFLKTWIDNPLGTGAVSPSGRFLARSMARAVDPASSGPVIELGPGTGPVTEALIERGIAPSRLVLVEFEPHFCRLLARRYDGVRIVQGDAYRLAETLRDELGEPAAAIVSGLPLRTRPERDRLALLADAFTLLAPGAPFVQFTYGIASPMPRHFGYGPHFQAEVSGPVWLNLPPARVWVYRSSAQNVPRSERESDIFLKLKTGTEHLGQELRETGDRLKLGLRQKALKARAGFLARADKVRNGFDRKLCKEPGWEAQHDHTDPDPRDRLRRRR